MAIVIYRLHIKYIYMVRCCANGCTSILYLPFGFLLLLGVEALVLELLHLADG